MDYVGNVPAVWPQNQLQGGHRGRVFGFYEAVSKKLMKKNPMKIRLGTGI